MLFTVHVGAATIVCSCSYSSRSGWSLASVPCAALAAAFDMDFLERFAVVSGGTSCNSALRWHSQFCMWSYMCGVHTQAPEGTEHEKYKKGQHLKGVDAANAERVRAEMVSAASCLHMHCCMHHFMLHALVYHVCPCSLLPAYM